MARGMSLAEQLRGGILGALIGDALGVPYEFHAAQDLPPSDQLELAPPRGFARAHPGVPPGTWSDDGAQLLALLDSLLTHDRLDLDDLGARLLRWLDAGDYAVDGRVFDVGNQTRRALQRLARGTPAAQAGPSDVRDNGNGALMRVLPLALWHTGSDAALVGDARRQGLPTHGHPQSALCCAVYVLWARRTLEGHAQAFEAAAAAMQEFVADDPAERAELRLVLAPRPVRGSGYVVDTLHAARWACEAADVEGVLRRAIALGDDTDTSACVAGGIAGIRHGEAGIPARWRQGLRGRAIVDPLLERLVRHRAPAP
jgi:ADP-ribosylglycohydrolase